MAASYLVTTLVKYMTLAWVETGRSDHPAVLHAATFDVQWDTTSPEPVPCGYRVVDHASWAICENPAPEKRTDAEHYHRALLVLAGNMYDRAKRYAEKRLPDHEPCACFDVEYNYPWGRLDPVKRRVLETMLGGLESAADLETRDYINQWNDSQHIMAGYCFLGSEKKTALFPSTLGRSLEKVGMSGLTRLD